MSKFTDLADPSEFMQTLI